MSSINRQELTIARDKFHHLLGKSTIESEWQKFFTEHPYVFSLSLPVRIEPTDILSLGRVGRAEPDFAFYPRQEKPIPFYGIIELKRNHSPIISVTRSNVAVFTRNAETAIQQALIYSKNPHSFIPKILDEMPLMLGNTSYLFVIMGMSIEIANKLGNVLYREILQDRLPRNLQLIPYDTLLKLFESKTFPKVHFLKVDTFQEFEARLNNSVENAKIASVSISYSHHKVNISYDPNYQPTKKAAEALKDQLAELGFSCTWSNYMIDGEDEEWTRAVDPVVWTA